MNMKQGEKVVREGDPSWTIKTLPDWNKGYSMVIRKMRPGDVVQVSGLLGQLGYPTTANTFRKRAKKFKGKSDLMLVAVEGHRVVGFISLHLIPLIHEDGFLSRITAFVVDEGQRKKGIGKKLLGKAEDYGIKNGAERSEITSGDHRSDTHRFYLKRGYQENSKRFIKRLQKSFVAGE